MDPHATTFLRNGAAAAASEEWTALLRHFAPTVLEFVAKYNDKPKWQQACLAILGPTFVEQYLPDGVSQQHLLEPPHVLRSDALAIKQQVKGALFRYLDARYGWSMDCLLDPEYDAKIAKGELPATNEPPEYVKYVRTVSKCYGDALVRQIRHIRRGQRHKGHKATRSIRRQGSTLKQLRAIEAATHNNESAGTQRVTHFVAEAVVQLAATERTDCVHHVPVTLAAGHHSANGVAVPITSSADPLFEYRQSPYFMKYRHEFLELIASDGRSDGNAADIHASLKRSLRGRSIPNSLREYLWWVTFFSPDEYDGVCMSLKRVMEDGNPDPTSSSLRTLISKAIDAHWVASVTSGQIAVSPGGMRLSPTTGSSSPSWQSSLSESATALGGVSAAPPPVIKQEHTFRHCMNLYDEAYRTNLKTARLQKEVRPEGPSAVPLHAWGGTATAGAGPSGARGRLSSHNSPNANSLRSKVESLLNQFYAVFSRYQEEMLPLCAILLTIFPQESAKSAAMVTLLSGVLSLEPSLHRPLTRHFSLSAFDAQQAADLVWSHLKHEDYELTSGVEAVLNAHAEDKVTNPDRILEGTDLLQIWTRAMFAGYFRPDTTLFLLDQCILGSGNEPLETTDNQWQLQFVKGTWTLVRLLRDQIYHAAMANAAYPVDLQECFNSAGFTLLTRDVREAWLLGQWPSQLLKEAANVGTMLNESRHRSKTQRDKQRPDEALDDLVQNKPVAEKGSDGVAASPMQTRWRREVPKVDASTLPGDTRRRQIKVSSPNTSANHRDLPSHDVSGTSADHSAAGGLKQQQQLPETTNEGAGDDGLI